MSMRRRFDLSFVVSTYAWHAALDAVLRALGEDADSRVEVVVAEDGCSSETAEVVDRHRVALGDRLRHVTQPDTGYRRARVLDLAALHARGQRLVFLDGDCVPRHGLTRALRRAAVPGSFVAGKRLHVSRELSRRTLEDGAAIWRWSAARWLVASPGELRRSPRQANSVGLLVPVRDRFRRPASRDFRPAYDGYGYLCAVSRADFERVNGFDTRYEGWGHEDVDLAVRLRRSGLRCVWPGPRATVLHLWHVERTGTASRANAALLRETRGSDRTEAVEGLRQLIAA